MRMRALGVLAVAAFLAVPAAAQTAEAVGDLVPRHLERITEIRHRLHENPELSNREEETAALVAEHLRGLGFDEVRTGVAHTGVVGILRGGRPGPVVAVRADMDALPVTEATGLPFASTKRATYNGQEVGVMHACGHDIHTAVGLGTASVLADMRAELPGTVVFIFQPAEEGPPEGEEGGAPLMLEEGVFEDPPPEAIFALHTFPSLEVGELGYTPGPAMAAADTWRAVIHGRQAHGAQPQESIDPVVMASQAVMALQTIRSRNMSALTDGVVTVGILRGGERHNIIPGQVRLEGTVRTFDPGVQDMVERRMREILDGITAAGGGSYELEYDRGVPVTVNDPALAERMAPTLARVVGEDNAHVLPPTTGAEDFAFFAREIPGFYFRLGTTKPGTTSGGLHTPTFTADDGAIPVGIRAMTALVVDYLDGGG
ncbi:MAG: amidohydrolase [Gemmatimonadetes bacterium]|nr:amidohydrolase [Gemmatimonadota bacterium]NIQ56717.1 amidohydrolase [Gemmatimonadota bacterium]NIU76903.1 amidohydrolase [Gammaproteobacteria bacterium]NIX46278.1 amidohydrolase [Gemmatimonadota bacterium]NIY10599.1 amidohydrolase [Gemmatimonadota bacterium]